jgi:hypothetical protein
LRATIASGGGATPKTISSVIAAQVEWTPPQTPQARDEMSIASTGLRPWRISS